MRESLGAALLRAGPPADAESAFREGLRRSPRNVRMLFGLLESLKAPVFCPIAPQHPILEALCCSTSRYSTIETCRANDGRLQLSLHF